MERLKGLDRSDGYRSKVGGNTNFKYFGVYLWTTLARCTTLDSLSLSLSLRLYLSLLYSLAQLTAIATNRVIRRHQRAFDALTRQATDDMHAMDNYTQVIRTFKKETSNRRHACHEGQPQNIPSIHSH